LTEGDKILVKKPKHKKMETPHEGPYTVQKMIGKAAVKITDEYDQEKSSMCRA